MGSWLYSLALPALAGVAAIAFITVSTRQGPTGSPARLAAAGFVALLLLNLFDTQRAYLPAALVCLVVPLQLVAVALLTDASLRRYARRLPRRPIGALILLASVAHLYFFFVADDIAIRVTLASIASAVICAVAARRQRDRRGGMLDRCLRWQLIAATVAFVGRAVLVTNGDVIVRGGGTWLGSPTMLWMYAVNVVLVGTFGVTLLLAIGKDMIDAYIRVATVDVLTGLENRRGYEAAVEADEAGRARIGSVVVVDLDHFKAINDTFGHDAGDEVLRAVGNLLDEVIGTRARIVRMGGEEFAVLIPREVAGLAAPLAEAVRVALAGLTVGDGIRFTASLGVAWRREEDVRAMMRRADAALYRAKATGRDRVVFEDAVDGLLREGSVGWRRTG